jgi:inner membrane transporter RhtA
VTVRAAAGARLSSVPAEALFVSGAVSQYVGAAVAVHLFDQLAAAGVAWLRVSAAALIIVAIRRPWRRSWSPAELRAAALFGVATAGMNLTFYLAIDELDLGTAVAIEFIGPIAVAVTGARTTRNVLSLVLATAGVLLLAEVRTEGAPIGIVYILLAAALWAGYIVLGSRVAKSGTSFDGLGVGLAIGALAIAPFGLPAAVPAFGDLGLLVLAAGTGLLSSVIPYGLDQVALRRLEPARFALLLALLPVTATVVGMVALSQIPSPGEALGIGIVIVAIAVRDRTGERPAREPRAIGPET